MNEIIINRNYNTMWGSEYIIMNEQNFIENNAEVIMEMMVKIKIGACKIINT